MRQDTTAVRGGIEVWDLIAVPVVMARAFPHFHEEGQECEYYEGGIGCFLIHDYRRSVEHAGGAASHHHALLLLAVVGLSLAAGTDHFLLALLLGRIGTAFIHDDFCNFLLDSSDFLFDDIILALLTLLPFFQLLSFSLLSLCLFSYCHFVVSFLFLQQTFINAGQDLRFEGIVAFLGGEAFILLGSIHEIDVNNLIETCFFFRDDAGLQFLSCLLEFPCLLLLLKFSGLVMLLVFLACQFIPLDEFSMGVLQEIVPIVDDVLIGGESLLELLIPAAEVAILPIPREVKGFSLIPDEFHVIFEEASPLSEIIAALLFGVVELLVDEVFDEGVDVRFKEERIAEAGLSGRCAVVQSPHPETEEGLLQACCSHGLLVVLVEGDLFFEVVADVLADAGVEVLPEMEEILGDIEKLLSLGVSLVFESEEVREFAAEVVGVVLVLGAAAPKGHVFLYAEIFPIQDQGLAVCCEVAGLTFDEGFQLGRVDP